MINVQVAGLCRHVSAVGATAAAVGCESECLSTQNIRQFAKGAPARLGVKEEMV